MQVRSRRSLSLMQAPTVDLARLCTIWSWRYLFSEESLSSCANTGTSLCAVYSGCVGRGGLFSGEKGDIFFSPASGIRDMFIGPISLFYRYFVTIRLFGPISSFHSYFVIQPRPMAISNHDNYLHSNNERTILRIQSFVAHHEINHSLAYSSHPISLSHLPASVLLSSWPFQLCTLVFSPKDLAGVPQLPHRPHLPRRPQQLRLPVVGLDLSEMASLHPD